MSLKKLFCNMGFSKMKKQFCRSQHGFTILELLVVITIAGLLVAVVTVNYGSVQTNARDQTRISDLKQIELALNLYRQDRGSFPADEDFDSVVQEYGNEALLESDASYEYEAACNSDYDVTVLSVSLENESNANTSEITDRCESFTPAGTDEYIIILDFTPRN